MKLPITRRPWFGPRRYSWGWSPLTWQGWVVVVIFLAALGASIYFLRGPVRLMAQGACILALVAVSYFTSVKPEEKDVKKK